MRTGWLSAQWPWPGSEEGLIHLSSHEWPEGRPTKRKKGRTSGVGKQNDRWSIILVKQLSPRCTFTFHQEVWMHTVWRNAPRGSLRVTLTEHRSPQHRLSYPSLCQTHVPTRPSSICILSIIWGWYLSKPKEEHPCPPPFNRFTVII